MTNLAFHPFPVLLLAVAGTISIAPPAAAEEAAVPDAPTAAPAQPPAAEPGRPAPLAPRDATARPAAPVAPVTAPAEAEARENEVQSANLQRRAFDRPIPVGIKLGGYFQAQYQHNGLSSDELQQGSPLNQNEFVVRRARIRLDHGWDFAAATLELDANNVRGPIIGIRRAEGSLFYRGGNAKNLPPVIGIMAGITDLPFGFEIQESARARLFMERSFGSSALFPTEADAGAKLFGAYSVLRYSIGVSNGEPVDPRGFPRDPNNAKDVTGRLGAEGNVARGLELSGGASFAVGKGFHAGQAATKATLTWRDDNRDGVVDPAEIVGSPATAATASQNFDRHVFGVDLEGSLQTALGQTRVYGELFAAKNYDRGFVVADPVVLKDLREAGGYLAGTQELWKYGLIGFRASFYDPNSKLFGGRQNTTLAKNQVVRTYSPLVGLALPERARLTFQYDFVRDRIGRDADGSPTDADNDQWTLRLQVEM